MIHPPSCQPQDWQNIVNQHALNVLAVASLHVLSARVLASCPIPRHKPTNIHISFSVIAIDPATSQLCEINALLKGSEGIEWNHSTTANEIGRLSQGAGACILHGTDTIFFIHHSAKPKQKTATYIYIVATD